MSKRPVSSIVSFGAVEKGCAPVRYRTPSVRFTTTQALRGFPANAPVEAIEAGGRASKRVGPFFHPVQGDAKNQGVVGAYGRSP